MPSLHCLSHILGIIFDIFSCDIRIYQGLYLQIMSRANQSHHLHCYHSDSSHYHLSPPTAVASSQVSVLLHLPPAICRQDSRQHDPLPLEVRLCTSSAQNSATAPSSLRTISRVLTCSPWSVPYDLSHLIFYSSLCSLHYSHNCFNALPQIRLACLTQSSVSSA